MLPQASRLLGWALLAGCAACQGGQPERDTPTRRPLPAAVAARPADSRRAAPVAAPEQLELLAVGDSIGPRELEVGPVGTAQLRAELAAAGQFAATDTVAQRLLIIKERGAPRVLYRVNPTDTVWTECYRLLDCYEHDDQQQEVVVQQANLDGRGRPEVLISFYSAGYGSGGGFSYTSHYLLDVSGRSPRLLLQASTGFVDETFPGYVAMHGGTLGDDFEQYEGFERTVTLRPREVVVGRIRQRGRHPEPSWRKELTQVPAGRYRYQQGRMYRVRGGGVVPAGDPRAKTRS